VPNFQARIGRRLQRPFPVENRDDAVGKLIFDLICMPEWIVGRSCMELELKS
jgi:hypothetical protein